MEEMTPMRHLYRSRSNNVFSGLCGGMGEYFGVDPVLFRLLWVFLTVFTGVVPGIFVYIVAIFIVPLRREEKSHSNELA
jgi:phage shock protein C